jgi:hypothetical protein
MPSKNEIIVQGLKNPGKIIFSPKDITTLVQYGLWKVVAKFKDPTNLVANSFSDKQINVSWVNPE